MLAVAVAAALAVPPVTSALRGTGRVPAGTGQATPTPTHSSRARHAVAAPGTVLSGCANGPDGGVIGRHWRAGAIHEAGPLWLMDGGHSSGRLRLYVAIMVLDGLRPGSAVVLKVAPGGRHNLRFLYGPGDSLDPGTRYTMRSGESGVTFIACEPDAGRMPEVTDYYGAYLVRGARCVPVRVWVPALKQRGTIRLGACPSR